MPSDLHRSEGVTEKDVEGFPESRNLLGKNFSRTTPHQNSSEPLRNESRGLATMTNRRRNCLELNNDSMEAGRFPCKEGLNTFCSEQRQKGECNSELGTQDKIQANASETCRVSASASIASDGLLKHDSNQENLGETNEGNKFGIEKEPETEKDAGNQREVVSVSLPQKDTEIFAVQREKTEEMRLKQSKDLLQGKDGVCSNMQSLKTVKEFEKARLAIEGLCNDMKRLEGHTISSDMIDGSGNQSESAKSKIFGRDNKQPVTFTETSEPVIMIEEEVGCDRTIVSKRCDRNPLGSLMDNDGCTFAGMDEVRSVDTRTVNTVIKPHQVLIVNPFPSPVPPSTPMINVTSNCQCDRYASLIRNIENNGKKKGRAKKTSGAGGGRRIQKTGASRVVTSNSRRSGNQGSTKRLIQENVVKSKKNERRYSQQYEPSKCKTEHKGGFSLKKRQKKTERTPTNRH